LVSARASARSAASAELPHRLRAAPRRRHVGRGGTLDVRGGELAATRLVALAIEVALDALGELAGAPDARGWIDRDRVTPEPIELGRHVRCARSRNVHGQAGDRRGQALGHPLARVERLEVKDLEENAAERIHVAGRTEAIDLAATLLGAHVSGRPHERPVQRLLLRERADIDDRRQAVF
jgi:hypothetical protein